MSRLHGEITLDQIDDWFKIGKEATSKVVTIPAGSLAGRPLDPRTGQPAKAQEPNYDRYYPAYKRQGASQEEHQRYQQQIQARDDPSQFQYPGHSDSPSSFVNQLEQLELGSSTPGSVGVPEDFIPEGATEVYKNYNFQAHHTPMLPISDRREEVIATIESNQVTIIQGSTGSGKTTQVPQYILDHYASEGRYCNIVVTQPRRIAAISIARRVCYERDWPLGTVCGYQIGMDLKASEDTRLLYCTTGVLREKLIRGKNMHQYTHVILDEVHERDQESDFALLIVKKLLRSNSRHVKVILMSATMNSDEFAEYFKLPVGDTLEPAPVVNVEGQVFKVSQFFADDLAPVLGKLPQFDEIRPMLHPEVVDMAVRLIQEFDKLEIKEQGRDESTGFAAVRGAVLVFLPGYQEISEMFDRLRQVDTQHRLTIIPLHSSITIDEQRRAFEQPVKGFRKVILSTNIAESSITVPDIRYVIDFCLTKNLVCDRDTNYTHLQVEWASHSNCTQRKGRAGRVSQGRAYFMVTRDFYEHCLGNFSIPEMQRCPLDTLVLKTKQLDMGEPIALLSQALSPPDLDDIERTILSLKEVGALCTTSHGVVDRFDGDLTFVGRVLADLPVDIRIGKLMILGYVFGLLEECLIIGAALSLKSIFANPFQSQRKDTSAVDPFKHKLSWSDNSLSDCIAILNAYRVWEKNRELQEFKRTGQTEAQWCKYNFIQMKRITEVSELVRELESRLERFNLVKVRPRADRYTHPQAGPGTHDILLLKIVLCGAFYPNYFYKKDVDEVDAIKMLSNHDPLNTVVVRGLPQNQGLLYKDHLVRLFSSCAKNPIVHVEESRAYIQFQWKTGIHYETNSVHPAVYTAIKLRHMRIPLLLDVYDAEEARRLMNKLHEAQEKVASQGMLRTNRMTTVDSAVSSDGGSSAIFSRVALPNPAMSVMEVAITEVVECGHFFAQSMDVESIQHRQALMKMLNNPNNPLPKVQVKPYTGMMCAAPYLDDRELYYRARIDDIRESVIHVRQGPRGVLVCQVFFVDYGNTEVVPADRLCILPSQAMDIPAQAFECELIEIRPSNFKCPDGKWSMEATATFRNMVMGGRTFLAQIYSVVRDTVRLELIERMPNGREICLNEQLVSLKIADKAEESYLSKQDHEWRMWQSSASNPQSDYETAPSAHSLLRVDLKGPPSNAKRRGKKINLTGPVSPLEMEFVCMTQTGSVRVDPESVNSAAVDNEPQNKHGRLMVAAFVGLNPEGRTLIARDTTIMPQIPGLPALLCLLFTPLAEFRVDSKRQRYTGALCGLGYNPDDRYLPLLPDHDMEVTFDVQFDDEDIHLINKVRHAINLALGSRSNMAEWGPDAVAAMIQGPARKKLLDMAERDVAVSPQINPNDLVLPDDEVNPEYLTLLPLHPTVELVRETQSPTAGHAHMQRKHIDYLHHMAQMHIRKPIRCELCSVTFQTSQLLALHLQTERHQRREEKVLDYFNKLLSGKPQGAFRKPAEERGVAGAFESDMRLTEEQMRDIIHQLNTTSRNVSQSGEDDLVRKRRKAVVQDFYKWDQNIVPYEFAEDFPEDYRETVLDAMQFWQRSTCLSFVPFSDSVTKYLGHSDRVLFTLGEGCQSSIGRNGIGEQTTEIAEHCNEFGSVAHELGHVLGFYHEQSRPDRDEHVTILRDNIRKGRQHNFLKYSANEITTSEPYDIGSVMHYGPTYFSKDGSSLTIDTADESFRAVMGQRNAPSFVDVKTANDMYRCASACEHWPFCDNRGYVGPDCTCMCPTGLGGADCREGPEGSSVSLIFDHFELEDDYVQPCAFDWLEIRTQGPFCGEGPSSDIVYHGKALVLHFHSDESYNFEGFTLRYTIVEGGARHTSHGLSNWTPWSLCSVTCDGGTRTRSRTCHHGNHCPDSLYEEESCNYHACHYVNDGYYDYYEDDYEA
ncbi:hypothetical protein BaRGS_00003280 [Batillaria attramentaria]|uniref:Metalloendopeptidase n=1 Tax=Batillaria attramentaria TaxID=370345 RepID=A0ABD0M0U2_9CAEN